MKIQDLDRGVGGGQQTMVHSPNLLTTNFCKSSSIGAQDPFDSALFIWLLSNDQAD